MINHKIWTVVHNITKISWTTILAKRPFPPYLCTVFRKSQGSRKHSAEGCLTGQATASER